MFFGHQVQLFQTVVNKIILYLVYYASKKLKYLHGKIQLLRKQSKETNKESRKERKK